MKREKREKREKSETKFAKELEARLRKNKRNRAWLSRRASISASSISRIMAGGSARATTLARIMIAAGMGDDFEKYFVKNKNGSYDQIESLPEPLPGAEQMKMGLDDKPFQKGRSMVFTCEVVDGRLRMELDNRGFTLVEILGFLDLEMDEIRDRLWEAIATTSKED